jgi:hypothetical protein
VTILVVFRRQPPRSRTLHRGEKAAAQELRADVTMSASSATTTSQHPRTTRSGWSDRSMPTSRERTAPRTLASRWTRWRPERSRSSPRWAKNARERGNGCRPGSDVVALQAHQSRHSLGPMANGASDTCPPRRAICIVGPWTAEHRTHSSAHVTCPARMVSVDAGGRGSAAPFAAPLSFHPIASPV